MKKLFALTLAIAMLLCAAAQAETAPEDAAAKLLEDVRGTYDELFTVICDPACDQIWLDKCSAVIGEEMAPMAADMLKAACCGTIYGQEAVDAYGDGSNGAFFDCYFIGGVSQFVFEGSTVYGLDENGGEVFRHEYAYAGELSIAGMMDGYLYETADEDAGEFRYIFLLPDTPESTYHIEFRYGGDKDALTQYNEGPCAYWLAAGILADRDDEMIENVIGLFCEENLAEMAEETEAAEVAFASGSGSAEDPYGIETADQLAGIAADLSANYVLNADIDLGGAEWAPIGTYVPSGESEEEQEIPAPAYAFTGSFDGNGHTISNLTINQPEGYALGLFGCASGAEIKNLTVENAAVDGSMMSGAVIGYAYDSVVENVTLTGKNVITGHPGAMGCSMIGGVVAAGMDTRIVNCSATASIVLPDGASNAGILGGGLEVTSVTGSSASGSIEAGSGCYGLGVVAGCGFGSEAFTDCVAENAAIAVGENAYLVGGIVGYAGGYESEEYGVTVTSISGCKVENVTIAVGEGASGVGDIVGGGFYFEEYASYGAPYDAPTVYTLEGCQVDGVAVEE